jgi:hypothetical protein
VSSSITWFEEVSSAQPIQRGDVARTHVQARAFLSDPLPYQYRAPGSGHNDHLGVPSTITVCTIVSGAAGWQAVKACLQRSAKLQTQTVLKRILSPPSSCFNEETKMD